MVLVRQPQHGLPEAPKPKFDELPTEVLEKILRLILTRHTTKIAPLSRHNNAAGWDHAKYDDLENKLRNVCNSYLPESGSFQPEHEPTGLSPQILAVCKRFHEIGETILDLYMDGLVVDFSQLHQDSISPLTFSKMIGPEKASHIKSVYIGAFGRHIPMIFKNMDKIHDAGAAGDIKQDLKRLMYEADEVFHRKANISGNAMIEMALRLFPNLERINLETNRGLWMLDSEWIDDLRAGPHFRFIISQTRLTCPEYPPADETVYFRGWWTCYGHRIQNEHMSGQSFKNGRSYGVCGMTFVRSFDDEEVSRCRPEWTGKSL